MALSDLTLLDLTMNSGSSSTITSASVSPTANALIIMGSGYRNSTIRSANAPTSSMTGIGTITSIINENGDNTDTVCSGTGAWYSQATASPVSGTVTATWSSAANQQIVWVAECTGHDTSSPIGEKKAAALAQVAGTSITTTLDNAPAATSMCVAATIVHSTASGLTATTGFTELIDANPASTTPLFYVQYDRTSPPTAVTRGGLASTQNRSQIYFEIKEASASVTIRPIIVIIG